MYPATGSGTKYLIDCRARTRRRTIVEDTPIDGIRKNSARSPPGRSLSAASIDERVVPRRFATASLASTSTRSG